ncbi:AAA family ATPase [candidate division KSB1 bacterium]|nr:AAA family ATPase [candidate division KSB1 bacterium]MBL7095153.1 AAA family ATPase [candidate division KSB1 bacterium]
MTISNVFIRAFKSIFELTIPFDPKVSVLIGPNESGKTNILRALSAFNKEAEFDNSLTCQYSDYYYQKKPPELILEFFNITKENRIKLVQISEQFKTTESFFIKKTGAEIADYKVFIDENEVSIPDMKKFLRLMPKIIYFDSIPLLKNRVDYYSLVDGRPGFTTERNLLRIGGLQNFEVIFEDSTRGRRASEEASRVITDQIRRVWSQEPSVEIKLNVNGKLLYIDISDSTTVFDTPESRSLGFRWYLSFYINFLAQTYEAKANEYVFLIDEPGIHLHPAGQKDLVKVLEDLSIKNQLIFTTHSPFMINRNHPQRVRLVQKSREGTKVDSEAYRQNWKPLRKSIGLMIGDLFFFSEGGLILEVPKDKLSLKNKLKFWGKEE